MTVSVKAKTRLITVPRSVQRSAGFKAGQVLEFKAAGGVVTIHSQTSRAGHYRASFHRPKNNCPAARLVENSGTALLGVQ